MSDFIKKIKRISTNELIYALSEISIKMYKNGMSYTTTLPISVSKYGISKTLDIFLAAWDIPSIEYFSVLHSSDYRDPVDSLPKIIDLYRGYENSLSSNQTKNSRVYNIFRVVMGMTSEQFQYQHLNLILEKLNRTYHILIAAKNYEHRNDLDMNKAFRSTFDFSAEDYLIVLLMIFWLCTHFPDPLSAPEHIYKQTHSTVFTKDNMTKIVKYYSCSYDELRNSSLERQLLYSKPFIHTKQYNSYLSSSVYMVAFLLGNGLYWLCRDYYKNDGQKFPNAFGNLFEDYIKELVSTYCNNNEWEIIPKGKEKSADYIFFFDSLCIIVESKSTLLNLAAKQQIPNLESADIFFNKTVKKAYNQLNSSYEVYKSKLKTPIIKVILLFDEFSNSSIIERCIPEIFNNDPSCFIMTIRHLEILLYLRKNDILNFNSAIDKIIQSATTNRASNFDSIFNELSIYQNPHIDNNLDYVTQILDRFSINLNDNK